MENENRVYSDIDFNQAMEAMHEIMIEDIGE